MTRTVNVTLEIPATMISNLLCDGVESGIGYWCSEVIPETTAADSADDDGYVSRQLRDMGLREHHLYNTYQWYPLLSGYSLKFLDREYPDNEPYVMTKASIQRGLEAMTAHYPRHMADIVLDNTDSDTADVFIQCCLFGEVIYG